MATRTTPPAKGPRRTAAAVPTKRKAPAPKVQANAAGSVISDEAVERDAQCMKLRTLGWTREQIAGHLNYSSPARVTEAISRHVSRVVDEPARDIREQMLGRLDAATNAAMVVLSSVHYVFHQGEQMTMVDTATGETVPVKDMKPILDAAKTIATLDDRRAKLLGIDAPDRQEVSITQLPAFVEELVARKRAEALGTVL